MNCEWTPINYEKVRVKVLGLMVRIEKGMCKVVSCLVVALQITRQIWEGGVG